MMRKNNETAGETAAGEWGSTWNALEFARLRRRTDSGMRAAAQGGGRGKTNNTDRRAGQSVF